MPVCLAGHQKLTFVLAVLYDRTVCVFTRTARISVTSDNHVAVGGIVDAASFTRSSG